MNKPAPELHAKPTDPRLTDVIKLAIMAVGGQGGGVLTNWIEATARAAGYAVQATSVAGVSQRTGATIYYIEMAPTAGVFSLAPAGGDVDILIAAELMEAGRAIMRGFVTPDRTTLIASAHRMLAVSEKTVPGDGTASAEEVMAAAELSSKRLILANMETLAVAQGSVISASLLGALAASETLPFPRAAFEDAIRASQKGVEASLRAFAAGFDAARADNPEPEIQKPTSPKRDGPSGPASGRAQYDALLGQIGDLPTHAQDMARLGLRKVVDFQDFAYGQDYLNHLRRVSDREPSDSTFTLSLEAAKHVANAMTYDDVIRVADLKTRRARFERIHSEMGAREEHGLRLTEFMHPRAEEIAGLLPVRLGQKISNDPKWMARLDRWFNKGRRVRSNGLRGFLTLYLLGGLRGWRRKTLRHAQEQQHLTEWLNLALTHAPKNYRLAVEILRTRRLIKGYSDTHARGLSKFDKVLGALDMLEGRDDAADWIARLREAALQDEKGEALDGALRTIQSFTD